MSGLMIVVACTAAAPVVVIAATTLPEFAVDGLRAAWRESAIAGLGVLGALVALRDSRNRRYWWDLGYEEPRLTGLVVWAALASVATAVIAGYRLVRLPEVELQEGSGAVLNTEQLLHGAGVPSELAVNAGLLALAGGVVLAIRPRLGHHFTRAEQRALAVAVAFALVPVTSLPAAWLVEWAQRRTAAQVVTAESFDPPRADSELLTADPSGGGQWTRLGLVQAIPAGDQVIGLAIEEDERRSMVVGLRARDGAELWRWTVRARVTGVVVDPVDRAALVLLGDTIVVLDFAGQVVTLDRLPPPADQRSSWLLTEQPRDPLRHHPSDVVDRARVAVLAADDGASHTEIAGVEVATGQILWRTPVPPQCRVSSAVLPVSREQPLSHDMLVVYRSSQCRTLTHIARWGPNGKEWSASVAPDGDRGALRTCFCSTMWVSAPAPDLVTAVVPRPLRPGRETIDVDLLVLDGDGKRRALTTVDALTTYTLAFEDSGPRLAVSYSYYYAVFSEDLATTYERIEADEFILNLPATTWPYVVTDGERDELVVRDAREGLRVIDELTPFEECDAHHRRLDADSGYVVVLCPEDGPPHATVVPLPPHG